MKTTLLALALGTALVTGAQAADVYQRGSTKDAPDRDSISDGPSSNYSWSGAWVALMAGYGVLAQSEGDAIYGVEGAFGELQAGYDVQFGRLVTGAYGCVGYSAIDDLSEHYCLGVRAGVLLTSATLLYVPVGYQWQHVDVGGESEDGGAFFSGPHVGLGMESKLSKNVAIKVEATHQWITDADGEDVSDLDIADNRIKAGVVFHLGGAQEALR